MSQRPTARLGRGLAALLGDEPHPPTEDALIQPVPIGQLAASPYQPRGGITPESLDELAGSIRMQGVLQPLLVRPDPAGSAKFEIVAGERRWRAAGLAGLAAVPCLVQDLTDEQAAAAALVENLQRLDLNGIEEAEGYSRLQQLYGLTQERIADTVGKSRSHVANTLRLLKLPVAVQEHVRSGALSAGHARAVLSHPDPLSAATRIMGRQLSVRDAEDLVARGTERDRAAPESSSDPDLVAVERDLSESLGVVVTIRCRAQRGTVSLRFSTLDQLDHLIARLGGPARDREDRP